MNPHKNQGKKLLDKLSKKNQLLIDEFDKIEGVQPSKEQFEKFLQKNHFYSYENSSPFKYLMDVYLKNQDNIYDVFAFNLEIDCYENGKWILEKIEKHKQLLDLEMAKSISSEYAKFLKIYSEWFKNIENQIEPNLSRIKSKKWHELIPYVINGSIDDVFDELASDSPLDVAKEVKNKFKLKLTNDHIKNFIRSTYFKKPSENEKDSNNLYSENKKKAIRDYCKEFNLEITNPKLK